MRGNAPLGDTASSGFQLQLHPISSGMGSVPGGGRGEAVATKHSAMTRDTAARTRIGNDMLAIGYSEIASKCITFQLYCREQAKS